MESIEKLEGVGDCELCEGGMLRIWFGWESQMYYSIAVVSHCR
jgi:hypothetical protein